MAEDNFDIFKFSGSSSRKVQLNGNRKRSAPNTTAELLAGRIPPLPRRGRGNFHSSDSDGGDADECTFRRPGYRGKRSSMAASRLLKKSNRDASSSDDSDEAEFLDSSKRVKQTAKDSRTPSPSPPHRGSLPSPPPPGSGIIGLPSNDKSRQVLNQANDVLNRLWYATPSESSLSEYHSDLIDLASSAPPVTQSMNLRVRYKGKVRKYPVNKFDPFSNVITLLAKELEGASEDQVLLSHKATTIRPADSPGSLGLTTADIIVDCEESSSSTNAITIKVQTSTETMKYSIASEAECWLKRLSGGCKEPPLAYGDPLRKVMVAFASKLDTSLKNLKFLFDGSVVRENQTPLDLDMEDDDCIDVATR